MTIPIIFIVLLAAAIAQDINMVWQQAKLQLQIDAMYDIVAELIST